jgi:hypothetical protein
MEDSRIQLSSMAQMSKKSMTMRIIGHILQQFQLRQMVM